MRTLFAHLSWPIALLSPQRTILQDLHFNLQAQSQGSYELLVQKQMSLIQSVPLMFPIHLWLFKNMKWLEETACRTKSFFFLVLLFPLLFWQFIWLHPPATFASIQCFPGHLCTLIWESKVGGGNNSTWKWAGDCLPPRVVMEFLSDRAPQAPPWWLISCGALELRSDTGSSDPAQPVRDPLDCTVLHNCPPFCCSVRCAAISSSCQRMHHSMLDFCYCFSECTPLKCFSMKGMCHRNVIHRADYQQVTTQ